MKGKHGAGPTGVGGRDERNVFGNPESKEFFEGRGLARKGVFRMERIRRIGEGPLIEERFGFPFHRAIMRDRK